MIYGSVSCRLSSRTSVEALKNGKTTTLIKYWKFHGHKTWRYPYSTQEARKDESTLDEPQSSTERRRIHVLGIGNIGRLFAHSLARLPDRPPITLLFHRPTLVQDFKHAREAIEITTDGIANKQSGFDYEVIGGAEGSKDQLQQQQEQLIYNLILCTKATQTIPALSTIKHRLTPHTTILFTQNGLTTTSHLSTLFPTPSSQPNYLTAVVFHGAYPTGPFTSVHAGVGYINVALTAISLTSPSSHKYLLRTVLQLPAINAIEVTPQELLLIQLEKLVVNAVINPLTALFRIRNGELYDFPALRPLVRAVVEETSAVILALPELAAVAGATRERFAVPALESLVEGKALLTRGNKSSMLQDVEEGKRETEVRYINGWVVERGRALGVEVRVNERAVRMVEEGKVLQLDEVGEVFGL